MKKKVLSLLLALCLIFSALPVMSFAAEAEAPAAFQAESLGGAIKDLSAGEKRPTLNATYYDNPADAGYYLRDHMVDREKSWPVSMVLDYEVTEDLLIEAANQILYYAFICPADPDQGDYLYFNTPYVEFEWGGFVDGDGRAFVDFEFYFTYLSTAEQEKAVNQEVAKIMSELDIKNLKSYDRVNAVYDYICSNVAYEGIVKDDSKITSLTAHAALIDGSATDYGIALALYRVAQEAGIDCRIIGGTVNGEDRVWNLMAMDGWYYYVDAALDAGKTEYQYFMKGSKTLTDHVPYEEYIDDEQFTVQEYDLGPDYGHQFGEEQEIQKGTCTQDGIYHRVCGCGYVLERIVPAPGHISKEDGVVTKEPTCEEPGVLTFACDTCGETYTEEIKATGHDYTSETTKEPTCAEKGEKTHTCSVCGDVYVEELELLPHTYESAVTLEPTCEEEGEKTFTCSACGHVYTEKLEPTGHEYAGEITKEPTCTEKGEKTFTCAKCGDVYTEALDMIPHEYESVVTTEPTCEKEGLRTYTCAACGTYYTESIEMLPHVFKDDVCTGCGGGAVYRISGTSRYATAYAVADALKETLGVEKFDTIIVASGENFADALAGSYLAAVRKAPILLQNANSNVLKENVAYIIDNLADDGRVCILGGKNSVPESLDEALSAMEIHVQRFAGKNRFETNLAILESSDIGNKEILVCTAENFADSLSASAAGLPILLVNNTSGELSDAQKAFLKGLKGNAITIIGGVNSVSEELEEKLGEYSETVSRIAGTSREKTSVAFAEKYFEDPEYAVLAYSRNFPDGLCGGPLAYAMGAPLLLTNAGAEAAAAGYVEEAGIIKGYALGGAASLKDESVRIIFAMGAAMQIMTK